MFDGRLEKTSSQSSGGAIGCTTISQTFSGILPGSFHAHASAYVFPAERSDAAIAVISNCGWSSSNCANRCPTVPVAPNIPTLYFLLILRLLATTYHKNFDAFSRNPHDPSDFSL